MKFLPLVMLVFFVVGPFEANSLAAVPPIDSCSLPPGLDGEISKTRPHSRPVSLRDLDEFALKQYRKDFGALYSLSMQR